MPDPAGYHFWRDFFLKHLTEGKGILLWIVGLAISAGAGLVTKNLDVGLIAVGAVVLTALGSALLESRAWLKSSLLKAQTKIQALENPPDPDAAEIQRLDIIEIFKVVFGDLVRLKQQEDLCRAYGPAYHHMWWEFLQAVLTPLAWKRFAMKVEDFRRENAGKRNDEPWMSVSAMIGGLSPYVNMRMRLKWIKEPDRLLDPKCRPQTLDELSAKA